MKKFLAFILAIAMIVTFIPSAFATETDGEENWTIKCDVENVLNKLSLVAGSSLKALTYSNTDNTFAYVDSSKTDDTPMATSSSVMYGAAQGSRRFFKLVGKSFISLKVNIVKAGKYSLKVNHQLAKKGTSVNVYVTPVATYTTNPFTTDSAGNFEQYGDYNTNGGTANDFANATAWQEEPSTAFTDKELSVGEYVITFCVNGSANGCVGSFTLEGTPVEAEEASGISIKYDIKAIMKAEGLHTGNEGTKPLVNVDYNTTNGFFDVIGRVGTVSYASTKDTTYNFLKLKEGAQVVININVPEDGVYSLRTSYQQAKNGTDVKVYLDGSQTEVASYSCYSSEGPDKITAGSGSDGHWINNDIIAENISLSAGEHMIRFSVPGTEVKEASVGTFELITDAGKGTTDMDGFIKVDNTTLAVDEKANILGAVVCSSDGTVKAQSDTNTVYESSDESVVKVTENGTTIEAVGVGTADITTTVGGVTAKRTITVLNKSVSGKVSFGVYSDVANSVTVTVDEAASNVIVDSVAVGSWIRATAKTDDPNYIFRGWKRGSADNGVWISENTEIYFPIMTNTFLTAVYEPVAEEEDTVNVEFYNYNGQYIETAKDVETATFAAIKPKEEPVLTGYTEPFWTIDGENAIANDATFKKLTRVVANYRNKDSFNITIGNGISGAMSGEYAYDTELVLRADKEGTWYVDGKPVAYGEAYLHCVWNEADITFDDAENTAPLITLDGETKENGARMISYDANGVSIAEVGIIFGKNAEITSFDSKAAAKKRGNSQGQFTAMPYNGDGEDARGYLIYNDNGTYRVIYAD